MATDCGCLDSPSCGLLNTACVQLVSPGDSLSKLPSSGSVRVGAGISVEDGHLVTSKAGIARQTKAGKVWVEGRQKR